MKGRFQAGGGLGPAIKALRKGQGLTLRDVARQSGLSTGFISKIERQLSSPSLHNLQMLCYALNVTINDLAPELPEGTRQKDLPALEEHCLLRGRAQRALIYNLNDMVKLESIFAADPHYKVDAMTLSGERVEYVSSKHRYDEIGIVSRGKMTIQFGDGHSYVLEEGDSLLIPAGTEHTVRKLSQEVCTSFWFKIIGQHDDLRAP